jgi:hypothetical protein
VIRHRGRSLLACLLLLAGCKSGTSAELRPAQLRIHLDGAPFDELTLPIGTTLSLTAKVMDSFGREIPGLEVVWSVDRPAVAALSPTGGVSTTAVGTARVVASHRGVSDTARINVAEPVAGPIECAPGQETPMAVGAVRMFEGPETVLICLPGGSTGNAEYTVIPVNTGTTGTSILPVQMHATNVTFTVGTSSPSLEPGPSELLPVSNTAFHESIRTEAASRLEPLLRTGAAAILDPTTPSLQLSVSDLVSLNVARGSNGCNLESMRAGRVRRVTERAILVADTLNPGGGFTDADYVEFGDFFDQHVWPLATSVFGEPSDIDGNRKVIIFFTVAVNELQENSNLPQNSGSYVGGFFYNRDLFPKRTCRGSNVAEVFYLLVPDPTGQTESGGRRVFPRQFVKAQIPTLLIHEFQHLINDSRRLHVNSSPVWEQTWLNEGLSHIAEELMFFRRADLQPKQNIRLEQLLPTQARTAFQSFVLDNVDRLSGYLADPEAASLMGPDLLATRGATWFFLRYAADRYPGSETALWSALVRNTRVSGLDNLAAALGGDPLEWMRDWSVALYADDIGVISDPRYSIPSWNLRALYPTFSFLTIGRPSQSYPLRAPRLLANQPRTVSLRGGGSAFARVGVESNALGAIRVTVGGANQLPPPSRLKVMVVRTR